MKQLLTLLFLFGACLLSYALNAQAAFTRFYGAGSDNAQERGLTVVPAANDQVMVVGLAQTIPDGANGISFHYLDRQSGEQTERHYLPRRVSEYTTRAFTDRSGNVALLNRLGTDSLSLEFFAGTHVPSWRVEMERSLFNVNGVVTLLPNQSALLLHEPTTGTAGRSSELVCLGANGAQLWTREIVATTSDHYFVKVISGPDDGHPVVLVAGTDGISLSSYDRLTGSVRWERSLSNVAGQTYPLAIELVTDDVNDRILLIGSKSDGGFGSDVVTRLEAFSSTGITLFENALQTDRFGFGGELLVGEDGALFALQRCQLQRWSDYEREEAAPEAISGFCGDVDPDGFTRANYLGRGEIFVTGALTDGSNFDTDLVVLKAGNQDAEWVFTDGLPGQQDADFATSSAPVPDEGGFYLLASTALPDARYQARLLKTDQLGEVIWQRDFPPSEGAFGYGRGMLVLADQGVMIQYSDGRQSHLAIVEPDGTLRWDKATTEDYVSNQFRDINLVQLIDGSVVTHRNIRINSRSELSLNHYSLTGELLDEWIITGFTHRDPLTGMKLTKAGKLLLMGRPSTELSTVQIWQFDPNTESVDWKWETGSFNTEAKEVNDAVELPNGNILAAVELQTYGPGEEVTHQLRLVEIDENGSEVRVATHPTAAANILQHLEMTRAKRQPATGRCRRHVVGRYCLSRPGLRTVLRGNLRRSRAAGRATIPHRLQFRRTRHLNFKCGRIRGAERLPQPRLRAIMVGNEVKAVNATGEGGRVFFYGATRAGSRIHQPWGHSPIY